MGNNPHFMLEKIFLTSLVVFAVYASMLEGMIFGIVREKLANLNTKMFMWLIDCPICQCSFWGTIFYWLYFRNSIQEWILVIIGAAGFNTIIVKFLNKNE